MGIKDSAWRKSANKNIREKILHAKRGNTRFCIERREKNSVLRQKGNKNYVLKDGDKEFCMDKEGL